MSKTSTKKRPNRKPALSALATTTTTTKRLSLGNASASTNKPHRKARKNVLSHQQTIEARETLDAEYRDWRTGTKSIMECLQPPDGSTTTTTTPTTVSQSTGLCSPSVQNSEQSQAAPFALIFLVVLVWLGQPNESAGGERSPHEEQFLSLGGTER